MIVSTTIASEIELFGRLKSPDTYKLVVEALVNTPVEGLTAPIGVLLIVPPSIVRPFITMASVIELFGNVRVPLTAKLETVAFSMLVLAKVEVVKEVLVVKVIAPPLNCISGVPVTAVPFR